MKTLETTKNMLGAVTLVTSIILFVVSTLIIIFAANFGVMQQKTAANINYNAQAFQAAEAGLEFAINYLRTNSATILANPVNGYIPAYTDGNISNVNLANNSSFTVVYSNPTAYNYSLIQITSTGTSADGTATRIIKQQVQMGSLIANTGTTAATSKGTVAMSGHSDIINTNTNKTILSASSVSLTENASTTTSSGGSSPGNINADITQNDDTLDDTTQPYFISNYLGSSSTNSIIGKVAYYYSNSGNTNYSSTLNGMQGTSIFINQSSGTATIGGFTTIGTTNSPVLLIVNGTLRLNGVLNFYGFILNISSSGSTTVNGFANIYGGIATMNNLITDDWGSITYNSTVLTNLQNLNTMKYYAKVPGTWKDF